MTWTIETSVGKVNEHYSVKFERIFENINYPSQRQLMIMIFFSLIVFKNDYYFYILTVNYCYRYRKILNSFCHMNNNRYPMQLS